MMSFNEHGWTPHVQKKFLGRFFCEILKFIAKFIKSLFNDPKKYKNSKIYFNTFKVQGRFYLKKFATYFNTKNNYFLNKSKHYTKRIIFRNRIMFIKNLPSLSNKNELSSVWNIFHPPDKTNFPFLTVCKFTKHKVITTVNKKSWAHFIN